MELYGVSLSPFVRKVMVYAAERGLPLEQKPTSPGHDGAEFRKVSPLGKIPGFTDGDFSISDSSAILAYLEAKYTDGNMKPDSAEDQARVVWFDELADTSMGQIVFKCFFNRVAAPLFMKKPGDEALAVEGETVDLPNMLDYLEGVVPEPGEFLVGDALSIADISVTSMFVNFAHAQCAVDKAKWPRSYAWLDAMMARPAFAEIIAQEQAMIAQKRAEAA